MNSRKQKKTERSDLILTKSHRHQWEANLDPNIYVSFSYQQFFSAYGDQPLIKEMLRYETIQEVDTEAAKTFKEAILREWGSRAGLPIKFLPKKTNAVDIRDKNVYFIFVRANSMVENANTQATTIPFSFPYDPSSQARYKVTFLSKPLFKKLTNHDIYHMLHEAGHAIAECKHFKPYDRADAPPFGELDCEESVMAYQDSCGIVARKEMEIFGAEEVSIFDPNPKTQKRIQAVQNAYPTSIGEVDIEAAARTKEVWKKRREKLRQFKKETINASKKNQPETGSSLHEELIISPTKLGGSHSLLNQSQPAQVLPSHTLQPSVASSPTTICELPLPGFENFLANLCFFSAAKLGIFKDSSRGVGENTLDEFAEAEKILLLNHDQTMDSFLKKICGPKARERHPEKVEIIQELLVKVLLKKVSKEVGLAFDQAVNISNTHLRFKTLLKLAKNYPQENKPRNLFSNF